MALFEQLKSGIDNGTINYDDVLKNNEDMERKRILEQHPYRIWEASDGRWKTYLPDTTKKGGRVLKAKANREAIEQLIVADYKKKEIADESKTLTIKDLYLQWIEYKSIKAKSSGYMKRINADWKKYYEPDKELINQKIVDINVITLDEWVHSIVKKYKMTKKMYFNMAIILRQSFEYAKKKGYIDYNPFPDIDFNTKLLVRSKKKESSTQVYSTDEQKKITDYMLSRFNNDHSDTSALAVILTFETGVRTGELLALKSTDIKGNRMQIQRQEVREYERIDGDSFDMKVKGFETVDYTKTDDGFREIYLTEKAREIIKMITDSNEKRNVYDDDYIFINKLGKRTNQRSVQSRVEKGCRAIGIPTKTMHKIRKTQISTLIDGGVNIDEIRRQSGHADERTTYNNYCFNRYSDEQTEQQIESAMRRHEKSDEPADSSLLEQSVIKCNQKATKIINFANARNPVKSMVSAK